MGELTDHGRNVAKEAAEKILETITEANVIFSDRDGKEIASAYLPNISAGDSVTIQVPYTVDVN